tara:strand:- start:250 stop:426 length:177 start_codon:yes stop_codon:yes gene_type:complete
MKRKQWLKYLHIVDEMQKKGIVTHNDKVSVIDKLIDRERKECDKIEMTNAGLVKQGKK